MIEAARRARAQLNRVVWGSVLIAGRPIAAVLEGLFPGRGYGLRLAVRVVPVLVWTFGIKVEVIRATPPETERCVYVCNHRSYFDYLALLAALGEVRFVAGRWLFDVPIIGPSLRSIGTVAVDPTDPSTSIGSLAALAREGGDQSIVVFPEGRRWSGPRLLPFQTGAFFLAIEAGVPVVPIVIEGSDDVIVPARSGRMPIETLNPGRVVVRVLEPISTAGLTVADRRALRDRARRSMEAALASGNEGRAPSRVPDTHVARLAL